jgi:hypothetical protein
MQIRWKLKRTPTGYEGTVSIDVNPGTIGGEDGHVSASMRGPSKAKAIGKAAIVAGRMLEQMEADPKLRLLLPPGAGLAIASLKAVAKSGAMGKARQAVKHMGGHPQLKRFADIL